MGEGALPPGVARAAWCTATGLNVTGLEKLTGALTVERERALRAEAKLADHVKKFGEAMRLIRDKREARGEPTDDLPDPDAVAWR